MTHQSWFFFLEKLREMRDEIPSDEACSLIVWRFDQLLDEIKETYEELPQ